MEPSKEYYGQMLAWMETARINQGNAEFYRGIVTKIGLMFGVAARTQDDGGIVEDVLALRVPELVDGLLNASRAYTSAVRSASQIIPGVSREQQDEAVTTKARALMAISDKFTVQEASKNTNE
jgi:hypothetical protein